MTDEKDPLAWRGDKRKTAEPTKAQAIEAARQWQAKARQLYALVQKLGPERDRLMMLATALVAREGGGRVVFSPHQLEDAAEMELRMRPTHGPYAEGTPEDERPVIAWTFETVTPPPSEEERRPGNTTSEPAPAPPGTLLDASGRPIMKA